MSKAIPIPVDAAREISRRYARDVVVIVAWERIHNDLHVTTYGKQAIDKLSAATLGEILTKAAGVDPLSGGPPYEDFRLRTQAEWAEEREALLQLLQDLSCPGQWLIWSNEHRAWWKPMKCGYTRDVQEAGRYSYEEARRIVDDACFPGRTWTGNMHREEAPPEVLVPSPEFLAFFEASVSTYRLRFETHPAR